MQPVKLFSCVPGQIVPVRHYQNVLRNFGIDTEAGDVESLSSYCIVLFDEFNERLCRMMTSISHSGQSRILALELGSALRTSEALRLVEAGATDVMAWSEDLETAQRIKARLERWTAVDELMTSDWVRHHMIGNSATWLRKLRELVEAARFTTAPVLLMGESGTGKELAACLIHELDPRPDKASLQVVDCTTIVPELSGSEFFGHERGAFTGAVAQREGAFALANGGTLFLDEIGDLPLPLQAQLLRVIQEGSFKRVGGNAWQRTTFRLICATNRNLAEQVQCGKFRSDLYFRIASLVHTLPPLRERSEDILPLVRHFMGQFRLDAVPPELDEATKDYFMLHDYAGNVRELRQRVVRLMHRYVGGGLLSVGHIPRGEFHPSMEDFPGWQGPNLEALVRRAIASGVGLRDISRVVEDVAVRIAVGDSGGNLQRAAQKLGVTDRALQMRRANRRQGEAPVVMRLN